MNKVEPIATDNQIVAYAFYCPGCKNNHAPYIKPYQAPNGSSWQFNGDLESPTFNPSILTKVERSDKTKTMICHLFVKDGWIQYLSDCTHELAGQTIEMLDVD
jgi:hypothetical protein